MTSLIHFGYLQLLDFLTTTIFLQHGVHEANPLVRLAMRVAPSEFGGLLLVKAFGVALALVCWRAGRMRALRAVNVLFALAVVWNLSAILAGA